MATKKNDADANAYKRFVATKYDTGKGKVSKAGKNYFNTALKEAGITNTKKKK